MANIHNLRKYKEANAILPDIERILKILSLTEQALSNYMHYIPAAKVAFTVKDQKQILELHHKELLTIKTNKGRRL